MIKIIAIGKKHENWIVEGIETFSKRLRGAWKIDWHLLPSSPTDGPESRKNESEGILSAIKSDDYVILLDERGKMLTSTSLSAQIESVQVNSRNLVFVIGGAYGVDDEMRQRADFVWSLSDLVFPHQLVRLILVEQIYRAQQISVGHPYHHQ